MTKRRKRISLKGTSATHCLKTDEAAKDAANHLKRAVSALAQNACSRAFETYESVMLQYGRALAEEDGCSGQRSLSPLLKKMHSFRMKFSHQCVGK